MIRKIGFDNFKRFKSECLDLDKPITLLYGENSSGKSSILKGLAAIIQTFSWNRNKHEPLVTQGEYANLGIFKDYVHGHDTSNKITFSITLGSSQWSSMLDAASSKASTYVINLCYDRSPYTEQARIYSIEGIGVSSDGSQRGIFKLKRAETKAYYTLTTNPDVLSRVAGMYGSKRMTEKRNKKNCSA